MKHTRLAIISAALAIVGDARAESPVRAVDVARATNIPDCTSFVDAASKAGGDGSAQKPHKTIGAAVEASESGAVICVAEGTYAEEIAPGEKAFTLAGGFQRGQGFKIRDSAKFVSKAQGKGKGSFVRIVDPGPKEALTAIDGFEITGYAQAITRDYYESQRFDLTNNHIHDNDCRDNALVGAAFALVNVSGTIRGNVIRNNKCGRGGGGFLNDTKNENSVSVEGNLVQGNAGVEPDSAHGGAFYFFGNTLTITGNAFLDNSVTQWGAGLYIGAYTPGNQPTTATMAWNVYRGNRAGNGGGGFFCDDGAACLASNEFYEANCGGNILVDGGSNGSGATTGKFDHVTNLRALSPDCKEPGIGLLVDTYEAVAPDSYTVTNSLFWGNAEGRDFGVGCSSGAACKQIKVSVSHTMADTKYADGSIKIAFGEGMVAPADPKFADPGRDDFRLAADSPAAGKASDGGYLGVGSAAEPGSPPPRAAAPARKPAKPKPAETVEEPVTEAAPEEPERAATPSAGEASAKEAFDAAKELGTRDAWEAFLKSYPDGFHADLARAYVKKLGAGAD